MDLATKITIIGLIFSVAGAIPLIYFLGDRIKIFRHCNYYLRNKKIKIKLDALKNYELFNPNIDVIKEAVINKIRTSGKQCEYVRSGSNYIEILIKESQAPYYLTFDRSQSDGIQEVGNLMEIRVKILGTIAIGYRDNSLNLDYLLNIENIYKIIENEYHLVPKYENYHLSSSIIDFNEDWQKAQRITKNGAVVNIGLKVVDIHSTTINSLYGLFKEHITAIGTKPSNNS